MVSLYHCKSQHLHVYFDMQKAMLHRTMFLRRMNLRYNDGITNPASPSLQQWQDDPSITAQASVSTPSIGKKRVNMQVRTTLMCVCCMFFLDGSLRITYIFFALINAIHIYTNLKRNSAHQKNMDLYTWAKRPLKSDNTLYKFVHNLWLSSRVQRSTFLPSLCCVQQCC